MKIDYLILDIDGTLTDGGIYYDESGNELKKFNTKDGTGIVLARTAGIRTLVITGRECQATTRRMKELGVDELYQNINDKGYFIKSWMRENSVSKERVAYIGDDLNDLIPMKLCGFSACPNDACDEIKEIADYVSPLCGGHGVARDVIKKLLLDDGKWESIIRQTYGTGI